jgi:archaellum biogenesis ATPase FlaH
MGSLKDKVATLGETAGGMYRKPEIALLERYIADLAENNTALDYLHVSRNLTDDTIKHFKLGYDKDRDAIAIPIFKRGELINIKYRLINPIDRPKYTQEKDCEVWIYNEEGIQYGMKKGHMMIVEGEFDLMSCWQAGMRSIVSPASGKDSYGLWLELVDNIPKIYISYDNDKPGREAAIKLAERIGVEKCQEIIYPDETIKDANDYFKKYTFDDHKELVKGARPFYNYQFTDMLGVINDLRFNKKETIKLEFIPGVKLGQDWLMVVSGKSNVGKTSYVMNLAEELVKNDIPTLVLPFERGTQVVGTRFLQVKYNYSEGDFENLENDEWEKISKECLHTPLYFSMPTKAEVFEIIKKSKRIFNTRVVIIDHLDYMIRSTQHKEQEIGTTLQELKRLAEENKILMIIVTHIRKIESAGSSQKKKPNVEDLKGSSSLYQDPECVVMLTKDDDGHLVVDVVKNKGKMMHAEYNFNADSGKLTQLGEGQIGQLVKSFKDDKEEEFQNF